MENPEKFQKESKIKEMIKISDDSSANLRAIEFVRKMNNQRRVKEFRTKRMDDRRDEDIRDQI